MICRPEVSEAAPYYFKYIDRVRGDVVRELTAQLDETLQFCSSISEEQSLSRYAQDKWSVRQVLNHITDCERVFSFRAFWFARGFQSPMPSFDQNSAAVFANADGTPWATHVEEFRRVRLATIALFESFSPEAWTRSGIASDNPITVRALAYIVAGHLTHHVAILRENYGLQAASQGASSLL